MRRALALSVVATAAAILAGWQPWDAAGPPTQPPRAAPPSDSPSSSPPASSSPSVSPTPAEPPPVPRTGACYRLTYDEAVAPTVDSSPVGCDRTHTSSTYLVGTLDTVVEGHLVAVDSARVLDQVATTCPDEFADHVGGTVEQRRLSLLSPVWFTPTVEESDAGATWFRCDVIAVARDGTLATLEGPTERVLDTEPGRARYGLCASAEPGTPTFERIICSADHTWRAVSTVALAAGSYPGVAAVREAGTAPCRAQGRAAAGTRLDFRWGYEWPTAEQWRAGRTYGTCWVPD